MPTDPRRGTLGRCHSSLDTLADDATTPFWLSVGGADFGVTYPFIGFTHLSQPISPGATATVDILRTWGIAAPQGFTLKTVVVP